MHCRCTSVPCHRKLILRHPHVADMRLSHDKKDALDTDVLKSSLNVLDVQSIH